MWSGNLGLAICEQVVGRRAVVCIVVLQALDHIVSGIPELAHNIYNTHVYRVVKWRMWLPIMNS